MTEPTQPVQPTPGTPEGSSRESVKKPSSEPKHWYKRQGLTLPAVAVIAFLLGLGAGGGELAETDETSDVSADRIAELEAELAEAHEQLAAGTELEPVEVELEPMPEPEPDPEPDPEVPTVRSQQDTITFGNWDYRVLDVEFHNALRDEIPRGRYVVLIAEFTNNANAPARVGTGFRIADEAGREYEMDSRASLAHHHTYRRDTWHLDDIGPGFTAQIPIAFDLPDDVAAGFFAMVTRSAVSDLMVVRFETE